MSTPGPDPTPTQEQPAGPPPPDSPWQAPPRQLWINPQKKMSVAIAALVAAVVLLGVGGVIGAAIEHHDHGGRIMRFVPADGYPGPYRQLPPGHRFKLPNQAPIATPSSTKSS